jgi:thermitase
LNATSNARVRIVRVLDATGVCTEADLASALIALDADVVNLSLGGYTADDQPPMVLGAALGTLLAGTDRVIVAAAGNDGGTGQPFWPAAFTAAGVPWADQVLAVAAHDGSKLCDWSNKGPWVSLAAPGSQITSTYVNEGVFTSGWAQWSGTSFAAPYVVAALAERHPAAGSVVAAAKELRQDATAHTYSSYPGLA